MDKNKVVESFKLFDAKIKGNKIIKQRTPSTCLGIERRPVTIIKVRHYGNDNSDSVLYCEEISFNHFMTDSPYKTVEVTTIDGETLLLNKRYIVYVNNDYDCVSVYLDSKNPVYPIGIYEFMYIINRNIDDIQLVDLSKGET